MDCSTVVNACKKSGDSYYWSQVTDMFVRRSVNLPYILYGTWIFTPALVRDIIMQVGHCVDTLVKNWKHIPVITFSSVTDISTQTSSLAFLIQMIRLCYFGILDWIHVYYFVIQISKHVACYREQNGSHEEPSSCLAQCCEYAVTRGGTQWVELL